MTAIPKNKSFSGLFIFKIGGQEFCLDLKEIINVIKIPECRICGAGTDSGLEYMGNRYPIISFDKLYNLSYKQGPSARIILALMKKKQVGFIVDEIIEFLALDENSTKIKKLQTENNPCIKSIIKFGSREMIMPDFEGIFAALNNN